MATVDTNVWYNMSGDGSTSVNIPDFENEVEGSMQVPNSKNSQDPLQPDFNTLDEPIKQTIMRDLRAVCVKFKYVLFPKDRESKMLLKEWDLWGPLMLCTFMAVVLQGSSGNGSNDGGPEFAEVFVIVWVGAMIVTLNSKLLGGNMSFFQSVCVLGYCLLSPAVALILCRFVLLMGRSMTLFILRLIIALSAFVWSTASCMVFLGQSQTPGRKILAGYPVCLFYAIISWILTVASEKGSPELYCKIEPLLLQTPVHDMRKYTTFDHSRLNKEASMCQQARFLDSLWI